MLHLFAVKGWNYYWVDENRAFLLTDRQDERSLKMKFGLSADLWCC